MEGAGEIGVGPKKLRPLLEGQTEEILYYTLLKRVYMAQEANCGEAPEKLRDLLAPLRNA
ncbi:hypothetical protein [Pyrobaculum islandicum]|uniref:hypothetical protein n=1 Tax=Pyrobaculum islandicum TaxID=2277 RepID=UPI000AD8EECA|nr:hypothetical protein [Pyrobaculum islandicum]